MFGTLLVNILFEKVGQMLFPNPKLPNPAWLLLPQKYSLPIWFPLIILISCTRLLLMSKLREFTGWTGYEGSSMSHFGPWKMAILLLKFSLVLSSFIIPIYSRWFCSSINCLISSIGTPTANLAAKLSIGYFWIEA